MSRLVYGLLSLLLLACSEPAKAPKLEPTLEDEKFTEILLDVRLLEGAYGVIYQRMDSTSGGMKFYYDQLYKKHAITREDFIQNYMAYSLDSERLLVIEDSVMARLERMHQADPYKPEAPPQEFKGTEQPIKRDTVKVSKDQGVIMDKKGSKKMN